jgi:hypothetical protein
MSTAQDSFEIAVAVRALAARHEVLSIALQEALKLLTPAQASRCNDSILARVAALTSPALAVAIPAVDEALAGELSAMLSALSR